jgi:hypothetical protein
MKRIINKEELRVEWNLDKWYEKCVYVFGWIYTILVMIGFIVGFVEAL